jgi:hypothetical protein
MKMVKRSLRLNTNPHHYNFEKFNRLFMVQTLILSLLALALNGYGSAEKKQQSPKKPQDSKEQWVSEIQLSGAYRLRGKGYASLSTPEGNFWVSEGRSAAGYKLIELDLSKSQPSALIQKGDQQVWVGLRSEMPFAVNRTISLSKLEKREGVQYVKGETEPFTGTAIANYDDNSKWETPYKDGKRHGIQVVYRDELLCEERSYIDGKQDGISIQYDRETGRKIFETVYKNGKISFRYEYNIWGNLEQKEFYENGKKSLRMKWDRYGKLVDKETY